jgi:cell division protein FtsQ
MQQFHDLNRMFSNDGLSLIGLTLETRGAWTLELDNGIRIVAGREQLVPRLRRFLNIYRLSLADKAEQIEQIDIRYTNGVAVSWRAGAGQDNAG